MSKKINRRKFLYMSAAGAAGLVLSSCAQPSPTPGPSEPQAPVEVTRIVEVEGETVVQVVTATPEPVKQAEVADVLGVLPRRETLIANTLTGRVGSPSNFNEWVGWKNRDRGMQQVGNEPLWTIDFATGEVINSIAADVPHYNEDFTALDIKIRDGLAWSDGEPLTADDIVFTVEMLKAHDGFNGTSVMNENVESVTAVDKTTVHFELKRSNSRFHTTFIDRWGCTWIMPKHIFEKVEDPVNFEFNPFVGSGPYKLHSYDDGGFWTIWEKREDWDKTPTGILYGEPVPKYVVFQHFANEGAKILAMLTHEVDILDLSSEGLKALLAQSKTARAYQPTWPFVVNNDPCITGICFNTARPPFDNREVRWALTLAIDIVEYVGMAVDGTAAVSPVHIPHLSNYPKDFIGPMQDWLKSFTIDVDGEPFAPYDPDVPMRMVEYARSRGYTMSDDPETVRNTFGYGWWKYAPDVAEKLLTKNGFKRDSNGKWLLPDGKPWKIQFICNPALTTDNGSRNAVAAVQQWQKFGIDAEVYATEATANLNSVGDYDVSSNWPAQEPWGAGSDLYRTLDYFNGAYVKELGDTTNGHPSRWHSDEFDAIVEKLRMTDPADYEATVEVGIEGLKYLVNEMPGIPTYGYVGFIGWDEQFWTNWPGSENPYTQPYAHWGPLKYMTPRIKPTGL